jgi:prevent-host-death family protein
MSTSKVKAFEAKTHFSELLDRVEQGERIAITRRGVHVATLVPVEDDRLAKASDAFARLRARRAGVTVKGLSIRELIEEGRR